MKFKINMRYFLLGSLAQIFIIAYIFRPYPSPNLQNIDQNFARYSDADKIECASIGDGGSVVVRITKDQSDIEMLIYNGFDETEYQKGCVFMGDEFLKMRAVDKIDLNPDTRFMIARLLKAKSEGDATSRRCVALLTGRLGDWILCYINE
jgi:hypothetical protein